MKDFNNWCEFDYKFSNYWLQNHGNDTNQPWSTTKIVCTKSNIEIWLLFEGHVSLFIILITKLGCDASRRIPLILHPGYDTLAAARQAHPVTLS